MRVDSTGPIGGSFDGAMLPFWIRSGPWLILPAQMAVLGALLALGGWWLGAWTLRGLDPAAHWTERARSVYPLRRRLGNMTWLAMVLAPIIVAVGLPRFFGVDLGALSASLALLTVLTSAVGALLVACAAERRLMGRDRPYGHYVRDVVAYGVATSGSTLFAFVLAGVEPSGLTVWAAFALVLQLAVIALVASGRHGTLLRVMGLLRPMPANDQAALDEAVRRTGVRVRASAQLRVGLANAVVFPSGRAVWISEKASEVLTHDEKIAVLTPSYPRPLPPDSRSASSAIMVVLCGLLALTPNILSKLSSEPALAVLNVAASGGQSPKALSHWADAKVAAGGLTEADAAVLEAASRLTKRPDESEAVPGSSSNDDDGASDNP